MNKEELISKIQNLTRKVKSPGRGYSKAERNAMKDEISGLMIELNKINLKEDILFIKEFIEKYPQFLTPEILALKNQIDDLMIEISDEKLKYILEERFKLLKSEADFLSINLKEREDLFEAFKYIDNGNSIPITNPNKFKIKEDVQKALSANIKALSSRYDKLNISLNKIRDIIYFFNSENQLTGFVYLSDAIFSDASSFERGFGLVTQRGKRMYFGCNGKSYKIESNESYLPKIEKIRPNPDLIPFEIDTGYIDILMGYKNSNNEIIIPAKFNKAYPFVNGYAKVGISKRKYDKITYGLIDHLGRIVLPLDFIELDDVYNDVVMYKKHIYKEDIVQKWNFDWVETNNYIGLFSGYLINAEIKQAIYSEIDKIHELKAQLSSLKSNGDVDRAIDKIRNHRSNIDFYLKYITEIDNNN